MIFELSLQLLACFVYIYGSSVGRISVVILVSKLASLKAPVIPGEGKDSLPAWVSLKRYIDVEGGLPGGLVSDETADKVVSRHGVKLDLKRRCTYPAVFNRQGLHFVNTGISTGPSLVKCKDH